MVTLKRFGVEPLNTCLASAISLESLAKRILELDDDTKSSSLLKPEVRETSLASVLISSGVRLAVLNVFLLT